MNSEVPFGGRVLLMIGIGRGCRANQDETALRIAFFRDLLPVLLPGNNGSCSISKSSENSGDGVELVLLDKDVVGDEEVP